jgi:hypothetical protein
MNTSKGFINPLWLVAALVFLIGGGGAAWWFMQRPVSQTEVTQNYRTYENTAVAQQNGIDDYVSFLCNREKYPVHITPGRFAEGEMQEQYFVYCEIPRDLPIPSLYVIGGSDGNYGVVWSKMLDARSSGLRQTGTPEIVQNLDNDGLSAIYWGGRSWGGTCAPSAEFGFLMHAGGEFSIGRKYEFNADCDGLVLVATELLPDLGDQGPERLQRMFEYLKKKVPEHK